MNRPVEWALFDGALLHGTSEHERLMAHEDMQAIYGDLGDEAASVGPLLLPACALVVEILQGLTGAKRFACAKLVCDRPVEALTGHLRALRRLHSGESAFYFRYADHRALGAVIAVLDREELRTLLGPIEAWHYLARDGRATALHASQAAEGPPSPPLHLEPCQWHAVLEAGRIGELYDATAAWADEAHPPCHGDEPQRYAWTAQAYHLLNRLRITDAPIRTAANLVTWQSAGRLLKDAVFGYTLREVQGGDSIERVFEFGQLALPSGARS